MIPTSWAFLLVLLGYQLLFTVGQALDDRALNFLLHCPLCFAVGSEENSPSQLESTQTESQISKHMWHGRSFLFPRLIGPKLLPFILVLKTPRQSGVLQIHEAIPDTSLNVLDCSSSLFLLSCFSMKTRTGHSLLKAVSTPYNYCLKCIYQSVIFFYKLRIWLAVFYSWPWF